MMQTVSNSSIMNSFTFDFTTSSGDNISLSLYDNRSLAMSSIGSKGAEAFSMSLKHEYGYSFSYSGNGIDAQDRAEIERAMEEIKPLFEKFLEKVKESESAIPAGDIFKSARHIRSLLPKFTDPNIENMLKSETLSMIDSLLAPLDRNETVLEASKSLFEHLFKSVEGFDLYA